MMILKILAVLGYVSGVIIYEYNFLHLPVFLIPAGLTILSIFENPVSNYVLNWSFYSILVYMLITYHEHDGCLIEKCVEETDGLDSRSLINIVATLVAWATIPDKSTEKKIPVAQAKLVTKQVPLQPNSRQTQGWTQPKSQQDWSKVKFNFTV